jgi:NAD(P)-dependent dehydrogenase (short-subunit alcohol dehydrogenase family)
MAGEAFLVSGGSGGIGGAVCRKLKAVGYRPLIGYARSEKAAIALAESIGGSAVALDLTNPTAIDATVARLAAEEPTLAGVVIAASPPPRIGPFTQIAASDLDMQWTVNVVGPHRLLAGLVKAVFRKQRRGVVVGVLSKAMGGASMPAMAGLGAYTIAKCGLSGLLSVLAADYPWLQVATVSPGFTETDMLQAFDERFLAMMREREPFQRADDVAAEILAAIEARLEGGKEP